MIQRIQSIYLFLTFIILGLLFFLPFAELLTPNMESYIFRFTGIVQNSDNTYTSTLAITVLVAVTCLISLTTIFLYKKRTLQIRLCIYNSLLLVGLIICIALYSYLAIKDLDATYKFNFASIIPVIAIILTILAFRKIRQDDQLVRGLDRIR
ncbi:DUF4293 domain-containing protein [Bacteroidota bacterium]